MGALTKRGHKIFVFIIRPNPKKPRVSYFKENGIDVIEIHPPSVGFSGKKGISRHLNYLACIPTISKEATKIISKEGIDFLYSYMPGTGSSIPAMRIKSKHDIPLILDLADMFSMIRPKIVIKKSFKESDKILVITNYLKNELVSKGISEEKIFHLPNGVDLKSFNNDQYSPLEIQKFRKTFDAEQIVLFSGSLQDLSIIINSAKKIIENFPKIKFIIVGDHRDPALSKSQWEKKVKEKNLQKYFEFLGKKPKELIPKYILSADICLDSFPNEPYFAAAHPIKLLEYGACEKPVVATNVSETSKIIKHGEFGFLAEPLNHEEYADFIIELLSSSEKQSQMGKNFSKYIKSEFGWDYLASKLENILSK